MIKQITLALLSVSFFACQKSPDDDKGIPNEFIGNWIFDVSSAREGITRMDISEEEKAMLEESFLDLAINNQLTVNADGSLEIKSEPSVPNNLLKFVLIETRPDGYIFQTINSMNLDANEFTLNTISNGIWRVVIIDESFSPIKGLPDNYWARPN